MISSLLDILQFPRPVDQRRRKGYYALSSFIKFFLTAAVLNRSYDIFQVLQEIIKVQLSPLKQQKSSLCSYSACILWSQASGYAHILFLFCEHIIQSALLIGFVIVKFQVVIGLAELKGYGFCCLGKKMYCNKILFSFLSLLLLWCCETSNFQPVNLYYVVFSGSWAYSSNLILHSISLQFYKTSCLSAFLCFDMILKSHFSAVPTADGKVLLRSYHLFCLLNACKPNYIGRIQTQISFQFCTMESL